MEKLLNLKDHPGLSYAKNLDLYAIARTTPINHKIMTWINTPIDIESYVGFVYIIKEKDTNMKYIGIKRFWKTIKYPPLKGNKNKRHIVRQSGWVDYKTSSTIMQQKLTDNPNNYDKIIVRCCKTVAELRCAEALIQLTYWNEGKWKELYNQVINLRVRLQ